MLCYDCNGCNDCFGSVGLRNKQYYIANKPYSKEEYFEKLKSFQLGKWSSVQKLWKDFNDFRLQFPHRSNWNLNVEHSVGNHLRNTKNTYHCFDAFELEDCAYSSWFFRAKDLYDQYGIGDSELAYEGIGNEEVNRCLFSCFVTNCNEVEYSDYCFSSHDLFGCAGVRNGEFMILNKRYEEKEFRALKKRLIEHMKSTGEYGEFFPIALSPFGYNETIALEKFPLTEAVAREHGYAWKKKDLKEYQPQTYVPADDINDEKDEVTKALLACEDCGRNYRVLNQDLVFYRKYQVPVPRHCVFCRHNQRMSLRMRYELNERTCEKCGKAIQTPYRESDPEKVYCEECYRAEIY